nr:hypothetical protein [uncultured bacterium]
MNEYIFFDAALQNEFVEFAASQGIACSKRDDPMGMVVEVPEDIDEELEDALEDRYAELQDKQSELLKQEEGGFKRLAGLRYTLPDGQSRMVSLESDVASRLLSVFTLEEVQALFETVAHSALHEDDRTLCQILAEENKD